MASKNLIRSALTIGGRSGRSNRAASHRGTRLAPLLLAAVMLAAVLLLAETSNPAQTAHAHGGDDHTHIDCSGVCPTYDDVPDEQVFLATTMTVGTSSTISGSTVTQYAGYGGGAGGSIGSTQFTYRGTTYFIENLYTQVVRVSGVVVGTEQTHSRNSPPVSKHIPRSPGIGSRWTEISPQGGHPHDLLRMERPRANLVGERLRRGQGRRVPAAERLRLPDHLDGADDGGDDLGHYRILERSRKNHQRPCRDRAR